jgi:polar amino acid transport system substrate-binding protein
MKKIKLFSLLMFCLFSLQEQAQDISLVVNIWPPYVDSSLPDDGLAMKIVKAAFKRAGYTPTIRIEKWEKALAGSKLGVYEVVGAVWKTKARQEKLLYSNAYLTNNIVLVAHANSQMKFDSLADLQGLLIGVLKDYEYDDEFMKNPQILKFQANRLTQNLIAVQQGKLDAAVADRRLAVYELKHFMGNNRADFQFLPKPLNSQKLYIAAPKEIEGSKALIGKFNKGLAAIKKDGTYQKIINGYTF